MLRPLMALLLLLAATVSGAAALVAEVVWFRGLGRGVGTSAEALAVVSAAFLGGLGVGAAVASRLAPRSTHPFRAAAVCEGAAGLLVFLSPFAIGLVPDAHLALLHALGLSPGRSAWPAALVTLPILMLPTSFLGATLPFLVRGAASSLSHAGRWTGALYAVNTIGAAAGVVLAVWFLLPSEGETMSLRVAGAGNLLAALLLLMIDRPAAAAPLPVEMPARGGGGSVPRSVPLSPAIALFLSGALALGGEVAWFRLLEPITGVHLYGFAFLLVSVLVGTALGGAAGGAVADRVKRPDLAVAASLAIGGLLTVLSIVVAGNVPWLAMAAGTTAHALDGGSGSEAVLRARVVGAALCIVPPLAAFASAYPLAVKARARSAPGAAGAVGAIYAWNTAGNVAGSLLAGFLLLPLVGSPRTLLLLGGGGCLAAAALWLFAVRPRPIAVAAAFLLPVVALVMPGVEPAVERAAPTLPEVVALGTWTSAYRVASRADARAFAQTLVGTYPRSPLHPDAPAIEPVEGVVSSVGLLLEGGDTVRLRQGGLSESRIWPGDLDAGSETEVALALVPYLVHPAPRRALVIGHGAGWTCEALLAAEDLAIVDVAELEPAMLDVVERYRGPLAVRTNPRARLHVTDGGLLLREAAAEGGRYDLVVSQPSHPWVPGAGHLFTLEAYRLARSALRPGGVFAQWLNIFDMNRELFHTALASWKTAFPESWLFLYNKEVVLVGFTAPPVIDAARWEAAFRGDGIGGRARAAGILGPEDLWKRWVVDGKGLDRVVPSDQAPATDDAARLELGLAWRRFSRADDNSHERDAIYAELHRAFPPDLRSVLPDTATRDRWTARTVRRLADGDLAEDAKRWDQAIPFDAGAEGKRARAAEVIASARATGVSASERSSQFRRAAQLLRMVAEADPKDPEPVIALLTLLLEDQRPGDAAEEAKDAVARFPDDGRILAAQARALTISEDPAAADAAFAKALRAKSPRAPAGTGFEYARLLLARATQRKEEARAALLSDPGTFDDRAALRQVHELDLVLNGAKPEEQEKAKEREAQLAELDRRYGRDQLTLARRAMDGNAEKGLSEAKQAVTYLPESGLAWRVKGWFELRSDDVEAAVVSLRRAITLAKDPEAERTTIRGWLRMFGQDASAVDEGAK